MTIDHSVQPLAELADVLRQRGLLRAVAGTSFSSGSGPMISGISLDSRAVQPGQLFVAVPGALTDGHAFVGQALDRGAVAAIVERPLPELDVPQLVVSASRPALAVAAAWCEGFPSRQLGVVGITGTDGKTTTAHLVAAMLSACGLPAGLLTSLGVTYGGDDLGSEVWRTHGGQSTPEAPIMQAALARMVAAGDRFAVIEATSHGLALDRVAEVEFDVGVLTNITREHLELHHTMAAYRAAKRRLFEWLAPSADGPHKAWPKAAVINAEDRHAAEFSAAAHDAGAVVLTFAADPAVKADVRATTVTERADGLTVEVVTPRWRGTLDSPLMGRFNAFNALAAVAVGEALALDPQSMRRGIESVSGVRGRMERIDAGQPFAVYVDYAHTLGGLVAVLDALAPIAAARGGSLISMIGERGRRDASKRPMMGRVAGKRSRVVVVTDIDFYDEDHLRILDQIARGAEAVGRRRDTDLFLIPDRAAAIRHALSLAQPNDVVVLAGKGHEVTLYTTAGTIEWDEAAVTRRALADLGYGTVGNAG